MKKRVLLTVLVLSIVSILISCKKSDDSSGSGSSTPQYGNVTFWSNENSSTITVTFRGTDKKITSYYSGYDPDCGANGCANYYDVPNGTYSFSARNYYGTYTWNGTVAVNEGCSKMLLKFKKELKDIEPLDNEHMLIKADEFDDEDIE